MTLGFRDDPSEPLRLAARAAGRTIRVTCRRVEHEGIPGRPDIHPDMSFGGKPEFLSHIRGEIDAGHPMVGFGMIGPPEACLIAGYREDGEVLEGWNFFQNMPEYASIVEKTEEGYFRRRGWFEHKETLMVLSVGDPGPLPDARLMARETMKLAVRVMGPYRVRDRVGGQDAFDRWAGAIGNDAEFPDGAPLHQLMERMMCMGDALTMVGEGRWYAHKWTARTARLFPEAEGHLEAAAAGLKEGHELIWKIGALLGGMGMGEKQARTLSRPEVRRQCVALILKARDWDRAVMDHYREALRRIGEA